MKDELTVDETAKALKLDASTVLRWIRDGKVPSAFRGNRKVLKGTSVEKIGSMRSRHGGLWYQHVIWTPYDRFESKTVTLDRVPVNAEPANAPQPPPPKFKELATMAKKLKEMGESNLAAHVSLRAVEVM